MRPLPYPVPLVLAALVLLTVAKLDLRSAPVSSPPRQEQSRPKLEVLVLQGSPFQRGLTQGRTLQRQIRQLVQLWKADLAQRYKTEADTFIKRFVRETDFSPALKKWAPDLLEEIRGLAAGSGVEGDTMFAFQFIDETWVFGDAL